MSYYTQRHGLRKLITRTETITYQMYSVLLACCENYYINLAWRFPEECPDGYGYCGVDIQKLDSFLRFEIPDLYRDYGDRISRPQSNNEEYNPYVLLDLIEFIAQNCRSYIKKGYHDFFKHYHLDFNSSMYATTAFCEQINQTFEKTGLLFTLTEEGIVERVIVKGVLTKGIENAVSMVSEKGAKELLEDAISLYKTPNPAARKDAVEKIWDALERLKTYYTELDKKASATKIVNDIAGGRSEFINLFNVEFTCLTTIGNSFRIRHHETNKIDITDLNHYDYFFNRCLALIALEVHYLK